MFFTLYWIAFAPTLKPYQIGLLFIHKNSDFDGANLPLSPIDF